MRFWLLVLNLCLSLNPQLVNPGVAKMVQRPKIHPLRGKTRRYFGWCQDPLSLKTIVLYGLRGSRPIGIKRRELHKLCYQPYSEYLYLSEVIVYQTQQINILPTSVRAAFFGAYSE